MRGELVRTSDISRMLFLVVQFRFLGIQRKQEGFRVVAEIGE